jgi:hypothetical protein
MTIRSGFSALEAQDVARELGLDFDVEAFDLETFRAGMEVELEHGSRSAETDVTGDDPITTGRIALAHLHEMPDYYARLARMEAEAEAEAGAAR